MPSVYVAKYSPNNLKGFQGADGRVDDAAFDDLFAWADKENMLALRKSQVNDFIFNNREPHNPLTGIATIVEVGFVWGMMRRPSGRIWKTDLQDFYHGLWIRCLVNHTRLADLLPAFLRNLLPPRTPPPPP